jgi:hypothetical protein
MAMFHWFAGDGAAVRRQRDANVCSSLRSDRHVCVRLMGAAGV